MNKLKARIDAFNRLIVDAKATGVWDSIESAAIMAGWSNVAGALTPLKGVAPTNNGFIDSDLDAGIGLKGNGSSKYLDSGAKPAATSATSLHMSAFVSDTPNVSGSSIYVGSDDGASARYLVYGNTDVSECRVLFGNAPSFLGGAGSLKAGILAASRDSSSHFDVRYVDGSFETSATSGSSALTNAYVFARNNSGPNLHTDATLGWYSIGSSVDLAALDTVVSQLAADLRAIDEDGFDPLATDYIRRVEAADGAYLETGVKQAINSFVVGCRKDGLLDALKASCILCGARTISGALVPLVGTAPTAQGGWAAGDYDRATGMKGNGSSLYLDSNYILPSGNQDDCHACVYINELGIGSQCGADTGVSSQRLFLYSDTTQTIVSMNNVNKTLPGAGSTASGFLGGSRSSSAAYAARAGSTGYAITADSASVSGTSLYVYAINRNDALQAAPVASRLSFYSIGSAIDLAALDNRVSTLISSISTALS